MALEKFPKRKENRKPLRPKGPFFGKKWATTLFHMRERRKAR